MKRTARLLLALALLCGLPLTATPQVRMTDPLLGLEYEVGKARFGELPAKVTRLLPDRRVRWIYAAYRPPRSEVTFYIVSSLLPVESDGGNPILEPDFGEVLSVTRSRVEALGVPDRLFEEPGLLPPAQLDGLMSDAARRYIAAFGGVLNLERELAVQGIGPDDVYPPLRTALEARGVMFGEVPSRSKLEVPAAEPSL